MMPVSLNEIGVLDGNKSGTVHVLKLKPTIEAVSSAARAVVQVRMC